MKSQELKQLRGRLRLSQAALGEEIGVSANTVARWERGEASIPKAVAKLLQYMAQANGAASAVATSGAIARDPHHAAILEALNRQLDPEVFEACAAALLAKDWPGLVPVRGGSDKGFDGAVASSDQPPFPLVTTTSTDAKSNLRRNLKRAIDSGWEPSAAIFATARRITPKTRTALTEIANNLSVRLAQVYDQDWFANVLYQQHDWCKKLLRVTGRPSALSVIPLSSRPVLGDRVLGREAELETLRKLERDCLVVGGPGSGKTFALRALALEGHALFLTDSDREAIANAIRKQAPSAIIVDDVHVNPEILIILRQLRAEIYADFKIIAVSWPADRDRVRSKLDLTSSDIIELPEIDADMMVQIIKSSGLQGPNALIAEIVRQTGGRPGLAVTLAHLCLRGNVRDVVLGDSLFEQLSPILDELLDEDSSRLLAAFSLGGATGCSQEVVAAYFPRPLDKISSALSRLSTAGVIRQSPDKSISVWPEPFRWVLVKRVFFGGAGSLDYKNLLNRLPDRNETLRTLLGARSRGASISGLEDLLEAQLSPQLWADYASLGPSELTFALERHPEFAVEMVDAGLEHGPEQIIPFLLKKAVGDDRALNSASDHPLRKIEDWITDRFPRSRSTIERRRALVSAIEHWWKRTRGDVTGVTGTAVRALTIAFTSTWRDWESDPGRGRRITISQGILSEAETEEVRQLWSSTSALIMDAATEGFWTDLLGLVHNWLYVDPQANFSEEIRAQRMDLARQIALDVAQASRTHPGVQHRLAGLAERTGLRLHLHLDPDFEVLYPREDLTRIGEQDEEWNEAVGELAAKWKSLEPIEIAAKISSIESEAQLAGSSYPCQSKTLCKKLAASVSDPLSWAEALIDNRAPAYLVEPFVRKAVEAENNGAVELLKRCLRSKVYRWVGFETLITIPNPPQELLDEALSHAGSFPQLIETNCLRGQVPSSTFRLLLTATDKRVALAAAIGEWNAGRRGRGDLRFPHEWREAMLLSAMTDDLPSHDEYWVEEILKSDPLLARDWLIKLVNSGNGYIRYQTMEAAKKVIAVLDRSQRVEVMVRLRPDHGTFELVAQLVGDDLDLYRRLLDMDHLSQYHLLPLEGRPDKSWAEKAVCALDADHSVEEVAHATRPRMWSWTGPESAMWAGWKEAFESFLNHEDPRVARVAERCVEIIGKRIERCLERESFGSVYIA